MCFCIFRQIEPESKVSQNKTTDSAIIMLPFKPKSFLIERIRVIQILTLIRLREI